MDDGWNVILGAALFIAAAYLFGPDLQNYITRDRVNVYLVDVSDCNESPAPMNCKVKMFGIVEMSIDKNTSKIVSRMDFSEEMKLNLDQGLLSSGIGTLENCSIFDRNNWVCGRTSMNDGSLVNNQLGVVRQVSGWEYRLFGMGVPLPFQLVEMVEKYQSQ